MQTVSLFEAKAQLSKLVQQVTTAGEPIIITKHGYPVVKIVLFEPATHLERASVAERIKRFGQQIGKRGVSLQEIKKQKTEGLA